MLLKRLDDVGLSDATPSAPSFRSEFVAFAEAFTVEPPVSVFATLLEIGGIGLTTTSPDALFKRTLDVAANVFGLPRSPSYDAAGNYTR